MTYDELGAKLRENLGNTKWRGSIQSIDFIQQAQKIVWLVCNEDPRLVDAVLGHSRETEHCKHRRIALYVCRREIAIGLLPLARMFGRDHANLLKVFRQVEAHKGYHEWAIRIQTLLHQSAHANAV